jgi:hypothetical protein
MLLSFPIVPVAPARFIFFTFSAVFNFEFVRGAVVLSVFLTGDIFIMVGELLALPPSPFPSPPFRLGPLLEVVFDGILPLIHIGDEFIKVHTDMQMDKDVAVAESAGVSNFFASLHPNSALTHTHMHIHTHIVTAWTLAHEDLLNDMMGSVVEDEDEDDAQILLTLRAQALSVHD